MSGFAHRAFAHKTSDVALEVIHRNPSETDRHAPLPTEKDSLCEKTEAPTDSFPVSPVSRRSGPVDSSPVSPVGKPSGSKVSFAASPVSRRSGSQVSFARR